MLSTLYPYIKTLHIIAVISWMAGMLYLPRLFVYHAESETGSIQSETFKLMEYRLLKIIINPAMIVTWIMGILLAFTPGVIYFSDFWFYVKFALVLILSGVHGKFSKHVKEFKADKNTKSASYFRKINEVPTVLMILIVALVVIRPF